MSIVSSLCCYCGSGCRARVAVGAGRVYARFMSGMQRVPGTLGKSLTTRGRYNGMSYATLIRQIETGDGLGYLDARALLAAPARRRRA